ncbi:hypothetical protein OHA38_20295 [Streptomyces sp. NBC_01732]|uniref:hypothetical protein n=1 Tax=Streptomyces sp. NBC_01732 TaxID=2975926 RepID=UPI00352E99AD|nr:hypothetical protein OHA38_20295 [Streptomyces sp. NBC_01732]
MTAETAEKTTVDPFKGTPYEGSPDGWWTEYGGALDVVSGVVYLPGPEHPPSPFHKDDCPNCRPPRGEA